jgi:hypothetical protein
MLARFVDERPTAINMLAGGRLTEPLHRSSASLYFFVPGCAPGVSERDISFSSLGATPEVHDA